MPASRDSHFEGIEARTVHVDSVGGGYPVVIGAGLLARVSELVTDRAPAHRYAVISDSNVAPVHADRVVESLVEGGADASLFTFSAGEASKVRSTWARITDEMMAAGFGRDAVVLAVGGGVAGDLGGFVAATYMRGVPVVQIPTSLLAMIDASVGGKTGVDVPAGKNLVGAFHPPRAVLADPEVLATLPPEERAQGVAEALKHGAIADGEYFRGLTEDAARLMAADPGAVTSAVVRSVEIKARVVTEDERERGLRQILNFGHTVAHGIEAAADFAVPHGTAVAAGMVLEALMGERMGITEPGTAERLGRGLAPFGLGHVPPVVGGGRAVSAFLRADKKTRGGRPRFVLLERLGKVYRGRGWSHEVPDDIVGEVLSTVPSAE